MKDKIEMIFTDEDLKLLKDYAINLLREPGKLDALLARLEAAEAVIANVATESASPELSNAYIAWRKAAGK